MKKEIRKIKIFILFFEWILVFLYLGHDLLHIICMIYEYEYDVDIKTYDLSKHQQQWVDSTKSFLIFLWYFYMCV